MMRMAMTMLSLPAMVEMYTFSRELAPGLSQAPCWRDCLQQDVEKTQARSIMTATLTLSQQPQIIIYGFTREKVTGHSLQGNLSAPRIIMSTALSLLIMTTMGMWISWLRIGAAQVTYTSIKETGMALSRQKCIQA